MSRKPVVVIGAGFGGLTAAIRLRAMGWPVLVLEATDQPGGRASVFKKDGFTFDAGPTVITAPYLIDELFQMVGRDPKDYYELLPVDPFYRVMFPDGSQFDYVGEEERILSQIEAMSPKDVDGYRRLAAHAERIFNVGYNQLVDQPFDRLSDMMRVVPDMIKLSSHRSVSSLVGSYIQDERLRQVFTFQPLLVGGNPFRTTSIYLLIHWLERKWGVWFPKGGTGALINAMVTLLDELGVEVRCNAPVEKIEVENGRASSVRLEDGTVIPCEMVVSNADPRFVYTKMIDSQHRWTNTDRSVARMKPSMSLFVSYFGAKRRFPNLAHHTIIMGPRYKDLLDDIFDRKILADDFSLYLHAPTVTDPGMAPSGNEAFYVLSPVPNQKSGIDWEKEAPRYQEKILRYLEKFVPGLEASITEPFSIDPRYFERNMRSVDGAGFGIEPTLTQSAWFRYHNRSEDVEDLFFVGASTHPGAGVPGVINSAKVLEKQVRRPTAPLDVPASLRRAG
jgi:phytoene desaturase